MEEIVHAFGIDWRLIAIQIFNFALLAVALWYFLYTPVLKILEEREAKLKQGVLDADKAAITLREADAEKGVVLKDAREEAEAILHRARAHAVTKGNEIVVDAETKALLVLEDAKARSEEERARARKESEAEVAASAILAAEQILLKRQ